MKDKLMDGLLNFAGQLQANRFRKCSFLFCSSFRTVHVTIDSVGGISE